MHCFQASFLLMTLVELAEQEDVKGSRKSQRKRMVTRKREEE